MRRPMNEHHSLAIKCLLANGTVFAGVQLSDIETVLKIILLLLTIGFTIYQWVKSAKKKDE